MSEWGILMKGIMDESTLGKYDCCKRWPDRYGKLRYRLRHAQVWVSEFGFHHTGFLDAHFEGQAARPLDDDLRRYLKRELQHNSQRFERQVQLVRESFGRLSDVGVMDIGCGGGLFLSKLREAGANVVGIEVDHGRAAYCREQRLSIETEPVDDPKIQSRYRGAFDVVTLWDVIEHVNLPQDTIAKAANSAETRRPPVSGHALPGCFLSSLRPSQLCHDRRPASGVSRCHVP